MKSIRIYQSGKFDIGQSIQLDKPASNHLIKVLRLKNNFIFNLFDGKGTEHACKLEIAGKNAIAHIESSTTTDNESNINIHLFQGISKGDRMDFAIQKSIELGVTSITPVITDRTVVNLKGDREVKKLQHWQAIAVSACEQSGRNFLPIINPIIKLSNSFNTDQNILKLLLDPFSNDNFNTLKANKNVQLLIGPEGGLSNSEIINATEHGYAGIKLGPRILRTETAALAAITSVQLLWGDLNN